MPKKNDTLSNLKYLASKSDSLNSDPYDKEIPDESEEKLSKKIKKPKKHKKSFEDFAEKFYDRMGSSYEDGFDYLIDNLDEDDEDTELRNSLISEGRKYARDYATSKDSNEVSKAFAPQEARLNDLLSAVTKDTAKIENDINELRMMRTRNYGRMSDLLEVKGELYNSQLQIIKAINDTKKVQFDIRTKLKENTDASGDNMAAQSVIQQIFGLGHDTLLNEVGGRAGSSGGYEPDVVDDQEDDFENTDEYGASIYRKAYAQRDDDGDKFLKYEGQGVEYVLEENEDGSGRIVYAEDRDGNGVDDYPIPPDVNSLQFTINQKNNTAVDQLQRKYKYKVR